MLEHESYTLCVCFREETYYSVGCYKLCFVPRKAVVVYTYSPYDRGIIFFGACFLQELVPRQANDQGAIQKNLEVANDCLLTIAPRSRVLTQLGGGHQTLLCVLYGVLQTCYKQMGYPTALFRTSSLLIDNTTNHILFLGPKLLPLGPTQGDPLCYNRSESSLPVCVSYLLCA